MRRFAGTVPIALGLGLAANSLLGPLVLDVIRYRFSDSLLFQGIGLDFVSLVVVAPLAVGAGVLTLRRRRLGPALGLGVGAYAAYMAVQYVVGPEYGMLPGNNERFFVLHIGLLVLGLATAVSAWAALHDDPGMSAGQLTAFVVAGGALAVLYAWLERRLVGGERPHDDGPPVRASRGAFGEEGA